MLKSTMEISITKIKSQCKKCILTCKTFIVMHKVDIITCTTDMLVSHPFTVLRRQCQVRADSEAYHLTPLTLVPVVATLVQRNGLKVLFKGLFSVTILRVVQFTVEHIMSRLTGWATHLPPTWYVNRDWIHHFLLKFSSLIVTTPIYSACVINTVSVPNETTNNFLIFKRYDYPLSFWQTMFPTAAYGVLKYAFTQAALSLSAAMLYLNFCFDETGRETCQKVEGGIEVEDRQEIFLKATVMSYLSAEVVFYPLETIVHRLMLQGTNTFTNDLDCGSAIVPIFSAHDGFMDCCDNILWLEGKLGLYKGFGALVLQAFFYHYCIKLASLSWRYIKMYKKTFYQKSLP